MLVIEAKQTPQDVSSEDDMEAEACARTDHPLNRRARQARRGAEM
jgi:hypothetical protein